MGVLARHGSLEVMYIFEFLPRYPDQIFEQMDLEESYFIVIITFNFPKYSLEVSFCSCNSQYSLGNFFVCPIHSNLRISCRRSNF